MNVSATMAALSILLVISGCGGAPKDSASSGPSASGSTSASASISSSKYDSGPRAAEQPGNEELAESGEKLFQTKGCSACHTFGKRSTGPDLQDVTKRRTAQWIEHQILQPEVMVKEDPISRQLFAQFALQMPNQGLTPDEARAVIEYFKRLDRKAGGPSSAKEED